MLLTNIMKIYIIRLLFLLITTTKITLGIDSYDGDPCKFAREIQSKGLNIKIDVISFGSKLENFSLDSQLQCLTYASQGRFERSGSRSGLKDVLNNNIYIDKNLL